MKTRLQEIAKSYDLNPHGPGITIPTFPSQIGHGCEKSPEVEEYLTPPVIAWDPLLRCSDIFQNGLCCPHESHASQPAMLFPRKGKDGHLPRKLYGEDCMVFLMSRVYVCPHGYELTAHDPRIPEHLSTMNCKMPFVLSHKSGETRELLNSINSLASAGLTFAEIERHLAQK